VKEKREGNVSRPRLFYFGLLGLYPVEKNKDPVPMKVRVPTSQRRIWNSRCVVVFGLN
jgi:hypothetical protein